MVTALSLTLALFTLSAAEPSATDFADDVETGTLLVSEAPPGRWTDLAVVGTQQTCKADVTAVHRDKFGIRYTDSREGGGKGVDTELYWTLAEAHAGDYHVRYWFRLVQSNKLGYGAVMTLLSKAGVYVLATGAADFASPFVGMGGAAIGLPDEFDSSGFPYKIGEWILVEASVYGLGGKDGKRRLWVNTQLLLEQTNRDFTGYDVSKFSIGMPFAADRTFAGIYDYDDVRAGTQPHASTIYIFYPGSTALQEGDCTLWNVTLRTSDGVDAPAPYPVIADLSVSGITGDYYTDASCKNAPVTNVTVEPGNSQQAVYFKASSSGPATLLADHLDFFSRNTATFFLAAPGVPDAGEPDAGSADAGSADAGPADAGSADAGAADAGSADAGSAGDAGTAVDSGVVVTDAGSNTDAGEVTDAGQQGQTEAGATDGGADAGTGPVRDYAIGCECSTQGTGSAWPAFPFALMLGALWTRRRRGSVDPR